MGQMKRWYPAPTFMLWLPSCHDRASRPSTIVSQDRKSTRLNSSHMSISYAVFCLKKKIVGIAPVDIWYVCKGAKVFYLLLLINLFKPAYLITQRYQIGSPISAQIHALKLHCVCH